LYETSERRAGENLEMFKLAFKAIEDRRPVDFREVREQEQTDLSADQRRYRRGSAEVDVEEVFSRAQRKQTSPELSGEGRFLRGGGTNKPARFEGGATEAELAVAGGIEGQTPASRKTQQRYKQQPQTTARGGSGSQEVERQRPKLKASEEQFQPKPEPEPEALGLGGGAVNVPIETIEQTTKRGRDVKLPKRFEGGATEAELAVAGGIEGQTPASRKTEQRYKKTPKPQTTARGGSGSQEVERQRPKLKTYTARQIAEEVKKSEEALRKANQRGK
jgi:hypothetical protein